MVFFSFFNNTNLFQICVRMPLTYQFFQKMFFLQQFRVFFKKIGFFTKSIIFASFRANFEYLLIFLYFLVSVANFSAFVLYFVRRKLSRNLQGILLVLELTSWLKQFLDFFEVKQFTVSSNFENWSRICHTSKRCNNQSPVSTNVLIFLDISAPSRGLCLQIETTYLLCRLLDRLRGLTPPLVLLDDFLEDFDLPDLDDLDLATEPWSALYIPEVSSSPSLEELPPVAPEKS